MCVLKRYFPLLLVIHALASAAAAATSPVRQIVVISDLHMGVGRVGSAFHPLEDFRWTEDLDAFLREFETTTPTDLVLNGDTFELWQSVEQDCRSSAPDLGCTEQEALRRIAHVLGEHREDLRLLRRFANHGGNRLFILAGNHDGALVLGRAKAMVREAIGARDDRVTILDGAWVDDDRAVFVMHGHRLDEFNYAKKSVPVVDEGVVYLPRSAGERFVQAFVDIYEERYPILDNVGTDIDGITHTYCAEGQLRGALGIGNLAWFLTTRLSRVQAGAVLGVPGRAEAEWDLDAVRRQGPSFIMASVPGGDLVHEAVASAVATGELTAAFQQLSDAELGRICDARAATRNMPPCPQKHLGRVVASVRRRHTRALEEELDRAGTQPQVVVLGHTHQPMVTEHLHSRTGRRARLVNAGAWQRTISKDEFAVLREQRDLSMAQGLQLSPADLAPCYPFVVITRDRDHVGAKLWFWQGAGITGRRVASCH
jgi:UDP-2,3-diacylglucosamine pyrophosphatase LpxH